MSLRPAPWCTGEENLSRQSAMVHKGAAPVSPPRTAVQRGGDPVAPSRAAVYRGDQPVVQSRAEVHMAAEPFSVVCYGAEGSGTFSSATYCGARRGALVPPHCPVVHSEGDSIPLPCAVLHRGGEPVPR